MINTNILFNLKNKIKNNEKKKKENKNLNINLNTNLNENLNEKFNIFFDLKDKNKVNKVNKNNEKVNFFIKKKILTEYLNKKVNEKVNEKVTELINLDENLNKNIKLKNFLNEKIIEKSNHFYNPKLNNKNILLLVATHTNTNLKFNNIKNTINYFKDICTTICVVNTVNLQFNNELSIFYKNNNISYYEINNEPTYDFGKWIYLLNNTEYIKYDFVVFINDSLIIEKPINHFINLTVKKNIDLYGYNDSTQTNYHYQSYLFSIRSDSINKFIEMYNSKKNIIHSQLDVINNYEVKMTEYFDTHDCFLKI